MEDSGIIIHDFDSKTISRTDNSFSKIVTSGIFDGWTYTLTVHPNRYDYTFFAPVDMKDPINRLVDENDPINQIVSNVEPYAFHFSFFINRAPEKTYLSEKGIAELYIQNMIREGIKSIRMSALFLENSLTGPQPYLSEIYNLCYAPPKMFESDEYVLEVAEKITQACLDVCDNLFKEVQKSQNNEEYEINKANFLKWQTNGPLALQTYFQEFFSKKVTQSTISTNGATFQDRFTNFWQGNFEQYFPQTSSNELEGTKDCFKQVALSQMGSKFVPCIQKMNNANLFNH